MIERAHLGRQDAERDEEPSLLSPACRTKRLQAA